MIASDAPCCQRLARRLIQGRTTRSWCATRSRTGATLLSCVTSSVLIIWSSGFALTLTGNSLSSSLLSFALLLLRSPSPLIYSINRLFYLEEAEEERPWDQMPLATENVSSPLLPPSSSSLLPSRSASFIYLFYWFLIPIILLLYCIWSWVDLVCHRQDLLWCGSMTWHDITGHDGVTWQDVAVDFRRLITAPKGPRMLYWGRRSSIAWDQSLLECEEGYGTSMPSHPFLLPSLLSLCPLQILY